MPVATMIRVIQLVSLNLLYSFAHQSVHQGPFDILVQWLNIDTRCDKFAIFNAHTLKNTMKNKYSIHRIHRDGFGLLPNESHNFHMT